MSRAARDDATAEAKAPGELLAGDVVLLDGMRFELLSKPFLGVTGASVFDTPKLFWRARVRSLSNTQQPIAYVTWPVAEDPGGTTAAR